MNTVVTGVAGFIGHHLYNHLAKLNYGYLRGIDITLHPDWQANYPYCSSDRRIERIDLRNKGEADPMLSVADMVFALAADMGGIGHIAQDVNQASIMRNNALININTLESCLSPSVFFKSKRVLFTSSVCVYPVDLLSSSAPELMYEWQAIPANPQDSYGWEKLFSEHLYTYYQRYGLETRIVRLDNVYGPECTWRGGKEKAPAALCRKVAVAKKTKQDSIEIWGDGEQRRPFLYIDDCVEGIVTVMESDEEYPVNLGPDDSVSINELVDLIMDIANVDLKRVYVEGPEGVRGRNFSHIRAKSLGWSAKTDLRNGMLKTYRWIEKEVEGWLTSTKYPGLYRDTLTRS